MVHAKWSGQQDNASSALGMGLVRYRKHASLPPPALARFSVRLDMPQLVVDMRVLSSRETCSGASAARLRICARRPRASPSLAAPQAQQAAAGGAPEPRRVVAVTGATGFVGSALVRRLLQSGARVRVLTRDVPKARRTLPAVPIDCFYEEQAWGKGIAGATAVVNLAGEPISKGRWSPEIKRLIKTSRLGATTRVVSAMSECAPEERPAVLVTASAVGYYGTSSSSRFDESSSNGSDYLAEVCRDWEAAAMPAAALGARVVVLRMGIVLDKGGGALASMAPVFQAFAGGPLGDGRQWLSWVHRDDAVGIICRAIEDASVSGAYNVTAPRPVRMGEFCQSLGAAVGRPSWLPVPEFAVQVLLGEGAKVVLEGQQVLPTRTLASGYRFRFSEVAPALRDIISSR